MSEKVSPSCDAVILSDSLKIVLCLIGKLVDKTKDYKFMYLASGTIVVISGIWLFIGNAINYRLLAKERKRERARKKKSATHSLRESEALNRSNQDDVTVKVSGAHSPPSDRERESNI